MNAMKKKLFGYMLFLAMLLVLAVVMGLFLIGRFSNTRRETYGTLDLQMSVFEKEVVSQAENSAAMAIQMSEKMTDTLSASLSEQGIAFSSLKDSESAIYAVQDAFFEPLKQFLLRSGCSGAFLILDTTVNSSVENADHSRTGIYLELGSFSAPSESVLLYRGISEVGKKHGILPHRKWRLEFQTDSFPGYDRVLASSVPLEKNYFFSSVVTLPGTSEKAMFLSLPLLGPDGTPCGICGFEISESYFKGKFAQPARFPRLTCLLDPSASDRVMTSSVLSCGITGGYYAAPSENLTVASLTGGLFSFTGENSACIGIRRAVSLMPDGGRSYLAVMIPKADYDSTVRQNIIALLMLVLLLAFFSVSISMYFSRRYLSPVIQEISDLKAKQAAASEDAEKIRRDFEILAPKVRDEIDDESYEIFRENLKKLTPKEKEVFQLILEGHTSKEITEIEGFTINALKYHNRNLYSKLDVSSKKELLKYITLIRHETGRK